MRDKDTVTVVDVKEKVAYLVLDTKCENYLYQMNFELYQPDQDNVGLVLTVIEKKGDDSKVINYLFDCDLE